MWMFLSGVILITLIIAQRQIMFFTIVLTVHVIRPLVMVLIQPQAPTGVETGGGKSVVVSPWLK